MTLNDLSSEQQEFVHLALSGKNVLCDACIGSGKTSTINVLCDVYPPERRILYLTYNRLLKLDAKDKIKNHNVLVQNYHGFASLLLNKKGIRNCGQGEQLAMVLEKKIPIPPIDTLIIDEYQDINDEIAELLKYIRSKNHDPIEIILKSVPTTQTNPITKGTIPCLPSKTASSASTWTRRKFSGPTASATPSFLCRCPLRSIP